MTMHITEAVRYETRDGRIAHPKARHPTSGLWVGWIEGEPGIRQWGDDGRFWSIGESPLDLIAPYVEPREIEFTVLRMTDGEFIGVTDPAAWSLGPPRARIKVREGDGLTPDELANLRKAQANG